MSDSWHRTFHDAIKSASCTRVLTLDAAVTSNSNKSSPTDSTAVLNRSIRGILGNLLRLLCWHYGWFHPLSSYFLNSVCKFHSSSLLVNIFRTAWVESDAPTCLILNASKIASQIDHKICVSIFSQATLQHMLVLISAHYHTNEDNFVFNISLVM